MSRTPQKLLVFATAILGAALLSSCSTPVISEPRLGASAPAPATSEPQSPTPEASQSQPVGLGVVNLDKTYFDEAVGMSITVQKANTVVVPYLPEIEGGFAGGWAGMIGVRIHTDGSQAIYTNRPSGMDFS